MGPTPLLQSIQIFITGVPDAERSKLCDLAREQGAVVVSSANANDPPHVVVVRVAGTQRYLNVLRRCPRIPVVTPEWLTESVKAGARLPYATHAAGALQGLKVCFSGLPVPEKKELSAAVLAAGAAHSTSLDRSCTHLVADTTQSDKYHFARHNKIHCVSPAWVRDSIDSGRCLDHDKYPVGGPGATTAPTASLAGAGTSSQQIGSGLARQVSLARVQAEADAVAAEAALPTDTPAAAAPAPPPEPWTDLDCNDAASNFLETCYLWMIGCTTAEEVESMRLAAQGGAKRFSGGDAGPHPTLTTHIVLGSARVGTAEAEAAAALVSERRDVAVVTLEWLRCSVAREQAMPADERFRTALPAAPRTATAIPATLQPGGGSGTLDERSLVSLAVGDDAGAGGASLLRQMSLAGCGGGGSGSGVSGFLDGCYFTLAAVRGTPEGAAAERLIRCHGGRLFSASLPPGGRAVYAICPYSLPPATAASLRSSSPDFAAVPETARFTLYWLECCCEAGQLIPSDPGAPCYQPLPYTLPLQGFSRVSVAISGYLPAVRAAIQRHVEIAGGHVSMEYMTSKQSHLIVPHAAGKKYLYTSQYGVVPVTADWLVQSLNAGKALPEATFAPLLPSGAPAPPLKRSESAGMDRAGSSPAPLTQEHRGAGTGTGVSSMHATAVTGAARRKGSGGVPKPALPTAPAAPSSAAQLRPSGGTKPTSTASGATGPPRGKLNARIEASKTGATAAAVALAAGPKSVQAPAPASRPAFDFDSLFSGDVGNSTAQGEGAGRAAAADAATAAIASVLNRPGGGGGGGGGSQTLMPPPAARPPAATAALNGGSPLNGAAPAIPGRSARTSPPQQPPPPAAVAPVSETQDDGGALDAALASLKDQLGRIGQRASTGGAGGGKASGAAGTTTSAMVPCSQIMDMPPPPVRAAGRERKGRAEKRTRSVTGGSEGSDSVGVSGGGQRRSKRRGVPSVLESESEAMAASQQVGYEAVAVDVEAVAAAAAGGSGGGARAAKERLTRAAAKQRRGVAPHSVDALDAIS